MLLYIPSTIFCIQFGGDNYSKYFAIYSSHIFSLCFFKFSTPYYDYYSLLETNKLAS